MLTTLGYRYASGREPAVITGIRLYLGGWSGIGRVVAGMARQQYDLQLTRFGQSDWQATFYPAGIGHSITAAVGTGWAPASEPAKEVSERRIRWYSPSLRAIFWASA